MSDEVKNINVWNKFKTSSINSTPKTIVIAIILCLFCSIIVSGTRVYLKPIQENNKLLDKKKNILQVSGLYTPNININTEFSKFQIKIVNLKTGRYDNTINPITYDQKIAAKDPKLSIKLINDPANIKRQAKLVFVYILPNKDNSINKIILPIHGYGLWSTLYGFIALKADANEIFGLQFYSQAETPGLGAEVDNPAWRIKWVGQKIYDNNGVVRITVSKKLKLLNEVNKFHVDALAGATLTSRGVNNLVRFWMGKQGFKFYLDNLRNGRL